MSKLIEIWTDGACSGNPGPGGWSFIIKYDNGETEEFNGSEKYTTNNKMELTAAIKALKYFKKNSNKIESCIKRHCRLYNSLLNYRWSRPLTNIW